MEKTAVQTKVLVFESSEEMLKTIHQLCDSNDLIPLKSGGDNLLNVLKGNTDMGGVIIGDDYLPDSDKLQLLLEEIHRTRPELPIFLRSSSATEHNKQVDESHLVVGCFDESNEESFKTLLDRHLFSSHYPVSLIRGIKEISFDAISANIRHCDVEMNTPYLIKDRIIYGELMSMIPLESDWYRGYMMLQTTEQEMQSLIENGLTPLNPKDTDFRYVNSLLNEITNLIWGRIKNQFGGNHENIQAASTQVPISINHLHKYISFGTEEPQLCFHYHIKNKLADTPGIDLYQKFVFNLSWYPENFQGADQTTEQLVESGELEFF